MPCYHPIHAFQPVFDRLDPFCSRKLIFKDKFSRFIEYDPIDICCGQCIGCMQKRAGAWAMRCMHESRMHDFNCFITLTYSDKFLPDFGSLNYPDFQDFMKRFRERVERDYGKQIRFYMCGEYGDRFGRPHYHAAIFGFDFPDRYFWRKSPSGFPLYRSPMLERLWYDKRRKEPMGNAEIGDLSYDVAAYIARYIFKKIKGKDAEHHYSEIDYETGEVLFYREPEFTVMSRRPGIGQEWFNRFSSDVFPHDYVIRDGSALSVPRYYGDKFEVDTAEICSLDGRHISSQMDRIKHERFVNAQISLDDNTSERLLVKKAIHKAKLDRLVRSLI